MKPKQLANVLTRILGLSMCAYSIPAFLEVMFNGLALLVQRMHDGNPNGVNHYYNMGYPMVYWLTPVVKFAIGFYLISRSRLIVEKLFKDEAE